MDDLISRALALEVISAVKGITRSQSGKVLCGKMYSQIKDLPSAKATPVVRCKDCKYSDVIYDTTSDAMPLKCLNIRYGGVQPDWYCEHGERREAR